jgi:serine protease Do
MFTWLKSVHWMLMLAGGITLGAAAVAVSQSQVATGLPAAPLRTPNDLSQAFRDASQHALPGVVMITAEADAKQVGSRGGQRQNPTPEQRFLEEFFGDQFKQFQDEGGQRFIPRQQGQGSGFIVDASGVVLTNSHVVEGADRVTVTLQDGRELQAESWSFDPRTDLAVVKIKSEVPLSALVLGNSDEMQVGDWVLALGNPFDVGTSVTAGIVSAKGRGPGINERENYIQTDAAINPGNSGGPLINLAGEVIGINTAISSRSGGYDGIGFAIPANMVRWVTDQLIKNGKVERSYLGVKLQPLTEELRKQLGVPNGRGALVNQVFEDTPAGKAGIQEGDVILEFAGKKLADQSELVDTVEQSKPHQAYLALVLRDGQEIKVDITLEPMPEDFTPAMQRLQSKNTNKEQESTELGSLGIEASKLTEELRKELELDSNVEGLVVRRVKPNTPAERSGLQAGDVITKVGTRKVSSLEEFGEALKASDLEKGILLYIRRGDASAFVVVK